MAAPDTDTVDRRLAREARTYLQRPEAGTVPITYQALAQALALRPPHTIHRLTRALEQSMHEDADNGHPFIAALVVSKRRGGLPAPGFFEHARRLGRFDGDAAGPEARAFHQAELESAEAFWRASDTSDKNAI